MGLYMKMRSHQAFGPVRVRTRKGLTRRLFYAVRLFYLRLFIIARSAGTVTGVSSYSMWRVRGSGRGTGDCWGRFQRCRRWLLVGGAEARMRFGDPATL